MDPVLQQEQLRRRRAILDALSQQNMQSPVVGNYGAAQAIAKIGAALAGRYATNNLNTEEAENRRSYGEGLGAEIGKYMKTREGDPGHQLPADIPGPTMPATAPNPRAAVIQAMASRYPELQKVGQTELGNLGKAELETFGHTPTRTKDGRAVVVGNRGTVKDLPGVQLPAEHMVVGGRVVNKDDPTKVTADYSEKWSEPYKREGDWFQKNLATDKEHKLDNAAKITNTVHGGSVVNKGESEFVKKLGEGRAKQFIESEEAAVAGYKAKSTVAQMKTLDAAGTYSGPLANVAATLGAFADSLGVPVDKAKLANSEAFQQQFAKQIAGVMLNGSIGRTMTDADRKRFEESLPQLISSPAGRAQVYRMLEAEADTAINRHQSMQRELQKQYPGEAMFNLNLADKVPGPRGAAPMTTPTTPASAPPKKNDGWSIRRGQ